MGSSFKVDMGGVCKAVNLDNFCLWSCDLFIVKDNPDRITRISIII